MFKPEVLAPAGNLEKLKVAVLYGADAVYLGGQRFGLRARADNFTDSELKTGVEFAHKRGAKVYVTLNAFLHDDDFDGIEEFCQYLDSIGVDAVICKATGLPGFHEIPAVIAVNCRLNSNDAGQARLDKLH